MSEALLKNYSRAPVEFVRGDGAFLYDGEDKEYLDFLSGIAVTGFGHRHPVLLQRVREQIENVWHTSNLFESSGQTRLAEILCDRSEMDRAFFCNSGTEANEAAIKFARKWGAGRFHIIATEGSFHGRTMGSLSATGQTKYHQGFQPMTPGFSFVPYGDASAVEAAIGPETVAVLVEPIQGENGIIVPPINYLTELRQICDRYNLLLILDEVQTGMGRTGKFFAHRWETIRPDMLTLAKGIANGFPLGAVLCSKAVGDTIKPGDHGSTFGGNPVAVSAAIAVSELLTESIFEHIREMGEKIISEIKNDDTGLIREVRGRGLMIGVELSEEVSAKTLAAELLKAGVVAGTSGERVIRLLPPFVINEEILTRFLSVWKETMGIFCTEGVTV